MGKTVQLQMYVLVHSYMRVHEMILYFVVR